MTTYITRRLIIAFFVLILVTLIVFLAMRLLPGDPIYMILGEAELSNMTKEAIDEIRHEYGLDRPIIVHYVDWIGGIFHGDFGISIVYDYTPLRIIAKAVPITLNLSLPAFFISFMIGIPTGVICAIRRGTWID